MHQITRSGTVLYRQPITSLQYATLLICFLLNMLDGMDVMIISYAAPAIAQDWRISPQALGIVFSAGLLGMTAGALVLAPFADRIGRKSMILLSAALIGISICLTSLTTNITTLIAFRFLSGMGIGSMLASTATLSSEYLPRKTGNIWLGLVVSGYPIGAVLSGLVAARVIPDWGWPTLFQIAGVSTLLALPLIQFFLSESLDFYLQVQPPLALEKANRILTQMGQEPYQELPDKTTKRAKIPITLLLQAGNTLPTIQLWTVFFLVFATLYFLLSWIPKLAVSTGLSLELAIYTGTVFNIGSFLGIITQGYFSTLVGLKRTITGFLLLTGVLMLLFKWFMGTSVLLPVLGLLGFSIQGGFAGLYAVAARQYLTEFRNTGIGRAIGIGRLGGIVGPALGGVLIGLGFSVVLNFVVFAIPAIIAGVLTLFLSSKKVS